MNNVRTCQFFLRGRCQRPNCQFLHPVDMVHHMQSRKHRVERSRSRERERKVVNDSDDGTVSSADEEETKEIIRVREEREKVALPHIRRQ